MTVAADTIVPVELPVFRPRRVPVGSDVHNQISEFYFEEAFLLDEIRLVEWTERLTEDLAYSCPIRVTRSLAEQDKTIVRTVMHFDETYMSILGRVGRLTKTKSAWAEDPPSRTRRFVTNILVNATDNPDEFEVTNYLLCSRSRFEETDLKFMSAMRNDRMRRVNGEWKLCRREIILDQSVLGFPNLAIFL